MIIEPNPAPEVNNPKNFPIFFKPNSFLTNIGINDIYAPCVAPPKAIDKYNNFLFINIPVNWDIKPIIENIIKYNISLFFFIRKSKKDTELILINELNVKYNIT